MSKSLISVIIPVFNEEANVSAAYGRVRDVMSGLEKHYDFEILFTDNHSTDKTFEIIRSLTESDDRVRCIRFSRDFGYQNSIFTGYLNARGDVAVQLDCDLQDPPELIPTFLEHWQNGNDVVYGVRRSRKENFVLGKLREIFYCVIDTVSDDYLPRNAGDFRMVSRRVLEELRNIHDQNVYVRGVIASLGFRQIGVPYDRDQRRSGASKFSFRRLVGFSLNAIVGHSILPLRIASIIGLFTALVVVAGIVGYFAVWLLVGDKWPRGFATLAILQLLAITLNALFLGIIGEYIGRIYIQVRNRPIAIIESLLNVDPTDVRISGRES